MSYAVAYIDFQKRGAILVKNLVSGRKAKDARGSTWCDFCEVCIIMLNQDVLSRKKVRTHSVLDLFLQNY